MFGSAPLHPVLPASDLDRAKRWYSEKLDLEPVREDEYGGAEYEAGGATFLLYRSEFAGTNKATAAGFRVDDFDGAIAELRSRGVVFEEVDFGEFGSTVDGVMTMPDSNDKAAWFKDSEGNILAISGQPE
jgi:catechol 2,3-dioxygenase-like lactoylglutathione lyase family enzyme